MSRMRFRGIVVLLVVLVLTSCGGGSPEPEASPEPSGPPSVATGDCVDSGAGSRGLTPKMVESSRVVDCAEPHSLEVLDVQDIPDDLVVDDTATLEYRDGMLDAVLNPVSRADDELAEWVLSTCAESRGRVPGLDAIELEGERGVEDFAVFDASRTITYGFEFPEESWEERPRLVCAAKYTEPLDPSDEAYAARAVDVRGNRIQTYLTPDFPVDERYCLASEADQTLVPGDCKRPHYAELVFSFDADAVLDDGTIAAIEEDPTAIPDEVYAELDALCTEALDDVIGPGYDEDAVTGYSEIRSGWTSYAWFRTIYCGAVPVDSATFDLGPGSLVGLGDGEIPLVPINGA